ncbi:IS1096 element passenger TnpR family protein [Paraburkholderia sp. SIMBA_054]|uniref:IS1096 element passenger TnpR family protein n=1 Tax=Paraburkholderia sp. SIMBA_054 TaxID=3085795 RepID=UPI0039780F94
MEVRLGLEEKRIYPCCIGGKRRAPTEDCGGPRAFVARRDEVPLAVEELIEDIRDDPDANDLESIRNWIGGVDDLREWLIVMGSREPRMWRSGSRAS